MKIVIQHYLIVDLCKDIPILYKNKYLGKKGGEGSKSNTNFIHSTTQEADFKESFRKVEKGYHKNDKEI
jgi:hypothetical protein